MTKKVKDAISKEIIETLNGLRECDGDSWGVFFLGTQIFMGKTRVYATFNTARARVIRELSYTMPADYIACATEHVDSLLKSGMLEIRKISDRSPKFPRNKEELDINQAMRLEQMLDAKDDEMTSLALTILKGIS